MRLYASLTGPVAVAVVALAAPQPATAQLKNSTNPAMVAGVGRVPMAEFGRHAFFQQPRLSPDGTKLLTRLASGGRDYIVIVDLTNPQAKPRVVTAADELREAGDRTVGQYRWVGNDNVILELASREEIFGQRVDLTRLVAFNLKNGKMLPLAWDGAAGSASNVLNIDHERGHILLERSAFHEGDTERMGLPEVLDVDVASGRYTVVQRTNPVVGDWSADAKGVVRLGYGYDPDNGKARIMYRSGPRDQFRTISNSADVNFTGAGLRPLLIMPGSDEAIVADNKDGFSKLYKVNLSNPKLGAPLYEDKGRDVERIFTSYDQSRMVGYYSDSAPGGIVWTDPFYGELQKTLDETFGPGNASVSSRDRTEKIFVIDVGAKNERGGYYLYNTVTGQFGLIGWSDPVLKNTPMNPVKLYHYTASDGVPIEAVLTLPRHRKATSGLPLLVLPHGGPFGVRDEDSFQDPYPWAQAFAEQGYVVVQPNYRGSGGYGAKFIKMGRDNGFGLRMQDDLNDAVTALAKEGLIDPKRVCMLGWSYGGYASARAAQRDADKYRCTVAGAGVYDLPMMRDYDRNYLGKFGSNYLAKGAVELSTVSPARNTGGKWAPILIVHGLRDQRVPVAQGRTLAGRLRSSGKKQGVDFDYLEQPKNTHHLPYEDVHIEFLTRANEWLQRWNPAYVASDSDKPVPVAGN